MNMLRFLLILISFILLIPEYSSAQNLLSFDSCHFGPSPDERLLLCGERHREADKLATAKDKLENYDFWRCYHAGRDCFGAVDAAFADDSVMLSYNKCRDMATYSLNSLNFETWHQARRKWNTCIIKHLRARIAKLRNCEQEPGVVSLPTPKKVAEGETHQLNVHELRALVNDTTWCPVSSDHIIAAVFCRGGGSVFAHALGQDRYEHRVTADDRLCLKTLDDVRETCFHVNLRKGTFDLTDVDGKTKTRFLITAGIDIGNWTSRCKSIQ